MRIEQFLQKYLGKDDVSFALEEAMHIEIKLCRNFETDRYEVLISHDGLTSRTYTVETTSDIGDAVTKYLEDYI